jgi:hypothetical protein
MLPMLLGVKKRAESLPADQRMASSLPAVLDDSSVSSKDASWLNTGKQPNRAKGWNFVGSVVTLVPCGPRESHERLPYEVRRPDGSRGRHGSRRLWMVGPPSAHALGRNR